MALLSATSRSSSAMRSTMTVAIRATNLVKSYTAGLQALDGVSLVVNAGSAGGDGSIRLWKSTLIRTFNGLETSMVGNWMFWVCV